MRRKILISLILFLSIFALIGLAANVQAATNAAKFAEKLKMLGVTDEDIEVKEDTVIMKNNINIKGNIDISEGNIVLDLNGFTIKAERQNNSDYELFTINEDSEEETKFTIKDSSEDQTGTIQSEKNIAIITSGSLVINKGTYITENGGRMFLAQGGDILINDGNFETKTSGDILYIDSFYENVEVEVANGTFKTIGGAVINTTGGNLIIHDGEFISEADQNESMTSPAIAINSSNVTINNGKFKSDKGYTIYTTGDSIVTIKGGTFANKSELEFVAQFEGKETIIEGGTFESEGYGVRFMSENDESKTIIKNGKFSGKQQGIMINTDVIIERGEFIGDPTNSYSSGAYYESGNVTIKGGTFTGSQAGLRALPYLGLNLKLEGGTFLATGTDEKNVLGSVVLDQGINPITDGVEENIVDKSLKVNQLVVDGYKFDNDKVVEKYIEEKHDSSNGLKIYFSVTDAKKVKVVSELEYIEKVLKDEQTGITLEGAFNQYPKLIIVPIEKGNSGYDLAITALGADEEVIGAYDASVEGGEYKGKLNLTFSVDTKYNGKTITIYHKLASGKIETADVVVKEGKATIEVNELSPFILAYKVQTNQNNNNNNADTNTTTGIGAGISASTNTETTDNTIENENSATGNNTNGPVTGDNIFLYVGLLLISAIGIFSTIKFGKYNKK